MFRKLINAAAFVTLLVALVVSVFYIIDSDQAESNSHPNVASAVKVVEPISLVGNWKTPPESKLTMKAVITDTSILVHFIDKSGYVAYWYGSFHNPEGTNKDWKGGVTSTKLIDPQKFTLSNAATKDFVWDGEQLHFDVTAMGITTVVDLVRG